MWTGELKVEKELNTDITTAFPITEAVPAHAARRLLLAAEPGDVPGDEYGERTTQWFIVSDLGLTAYSGPDGIHAFVNSLATTAPLGGVEVRLLARNNEVLADQEDRRERQRRPSSPVFRAAKAGSRRRCSSPRRRRRLRLPQSEAVGLRSDRPRRRRA